MFVRRNTHTGVAHRDLDLIPCGRLTQARQPHGHPSVLSELDGVVTQVGQHLTNAPGIAEQQLGQVGGRREVKRQPLVLGANLNARQGVGDQRHQIKRDVLHLQLAGLDLGEVQDVVEDHQQGFGRAFDRVQVAALVGVQRCAQG